MLRCPGQDQRFWKAGDIFEVRCAGCGGTVEFFKDEPKLKCRNCDRVMTNPKIDLGCAQWCQYAEQCVGVASPRNTPIVRDELIAEMKNIFGDDRDRINHTLAVLDYAERIQAMEGGDPLVVKAAAILHDIGIHEAERKYGSSAGKYQEIEGPLIAEAILERHGLDQAVIEHVCSIIANHHSARNIDTVEFRIVWDADRLVNIPEEFPDAGKEELKKLTDRVFKTKCGHQTGIRLFAGD